RADEAVKFATNELELSQQLIDRLSSAVGEPALVALLLGKTAQADERGIELTVTEETHLPANTDDLPMSGQEMVTVLGNLIDDAHRTYLDRLQGFSVAAVAHTARDAMRAASEALAADTPIDLVLLDIGLPDANGIALASGLSGLRPTPDIIAITSERDLEMV